MIIKTWYIIGMLLIYCSFFVLNIVTLVKGFKGRRWNWVIVLSLNFLAVIFLSPVALVWLPLAFLVVDRPTDFKKRQIKLGGYTLMLVVFVISLSMFTIMLMGQPNGLLSLLWGMNAVNIMVVMMLKYS